jgi:3,4-dihydroxy 2-butanone 4-phosphate synthase/GTP cyclohydrolase II
MQLSGRPPKSLSRAIEAFRRGEFVALLDRADREAEADLLLAAEHATGERINQMLLMARGLLTVALPEERLQELGLPLLEVRWAGEHAPRFAMPVDYRHGTTTGVSAFDRALTIRALADPQTRPEDLARPGHVFPLAARSLAERQGHTEGAVALALLAGCRPVVAMCEIMAPDGNMARGLTLRRWLQEHRVAAVSVPQIKRALGLGAARSKDEREAASPG